MFMNSPLKLALRYWGTINFDLTLLQNIIPCLLFFGGGVISVFRKSKSSTNICQFLLYGWNRMAQVSPNAAFYSICLILSYYFPPLV